MCTKFPRYVFREFGCWYRAICSTRHQLCTRNLLIYLFIIILFIGIDNNRPTFIHMKKFLKITFDNTINP